MEVAAEVELVVVEVIREEAQQLDMEEQDQQYVVGIKNQVGMILLTKKTKIHRIFTEIETLISRINQVEKAIIRNLSQINIYKQVEHVPWDHNRNFLINLVMSACACLRNFGQFYHTLYNVNCSLLCNFVLFHIVSM